MTRATRLQPLLLLALMAAALVVVFVVGLHLGTTELSMSQVIGALLHQGEWTEQLVVLEMRLPRLVLSCLIGATLSVSGVLLQGLSRNELASPTTVGVNAGSGLGIMLALVLAPMTALRQPWIMPLASVGGAMLITLLVFALAYRRGSVLPSRLLLVGIAMSYGSSAAMLLLSLRMDFVTHSRVVSWMSGSISGGNWKSIYWLAPTCLVLMVVAFSRARVLNVMSLGDYTAKGLGVGVERQRLAALTLATMMTSACAGVAGQIGFLGLAAPHLARRLVGHDHRVLLPAAALSGAFLLVLADSLGRHLFSPVEIPAGVLVGILGGSYFLYLLAKTKG
ncbi:FecCD family ABC transporter permease [Aeoliella mucimassa]|uniref:Iron-uptake system permease protein FeuC n=1 Tax=Aeoliella mucimassa TaxID=2527972 RepID=A0A518AW76_9BACT|nr:iron ABC transporter permease [Aeoliella mucimassa]QDU58968.1 Iron-uptake system permease protein FeuC [Aeoliella mucimassa]